MSTVQLSNVAVERGEGGLVTLQIEVAPESVQQMRQRVIKEYSRQLRLPGFRPGRVPPHIVQRNVGEENIAQRVSDQLVPVAYQQALEQAELQPLERAEVDQLSFDAFAGDSPLQFTARVVVRPEIELGQLEGLSASKTVISVTDDDVTQGLEALRQENATLKNIEDRGAQAGDVLNAELRVFINGEERGDEPAKLRSFVLGESGFVPSIDEHLVGAQLDEERRFDVTYPSDFKDEELAGQTAEFAVKVTALKERVLPEINDEFAAQLGLENVAAVNERMRQAIQEGRERENVESVRTQLAQAVTQGAQLEIPAQIVDSRLTSRLQNFEHELKHRELTMEQYLENVGQSREEFDAQARTEIENELRQELVLDEIARRQNLETSNEEIENHYRMLAQALQRPIEELVEQIDVNTVRASILQRKAVDWLVEKAQISEVEAGENSSAPENSDATDEA